MKFALQIEDDDGELLALGTDRSGPLIVMGDQRAWREIAADLWPILQRDAQTTEPDYAHRF